MRLLLVSRIGGASILLLSALIACSANDKGMDLQLTPTTVGGTGPAPAGGNGATSVGPGQTTGGTASGSTTGSGGAAPAGAVAATGGAKAVGGSANGGAATTGGATTGGARTSGGASGMGGNNPSGGASTGGSKSGGAGGTGGVAGNKAVGGSSTGGAKAVGGSATGGSATGGSATGGSATGGSATGGSATGGTTGVDGCSDTLALGVTMSEVAVFQTGKISIMKSGAAVIASTQYGADVIEGRPTLFRVYVTTDSGFVSRQLSARLTLSGSSTPYYAKQTISGSSTELTTANSFQISAPASAMISGLNYSVQIVECGAGTGTAHNPKFPASGTASVVTRATGVIKITLVPVTANGITPTLTSLSTSLKPHLEALYPTTTAQITIASTPITGCGITPSTAANSTTWSNCLTLVRNRRTADAPASDVYYVGVVTPAASYSAYCGGACIGGVGFVATSATTAAARALIAIGFNPQGLNTIAHELGHNHGLEHSPGCGADSADTAFPYVTSGTAYIGWVGWDNRTPTAFLDPARYTDLMAYCDPVWVSDYVYSKLSDRVAALNGAAMLLGSEAVSTWRVLDVIGGKATWGVPLTNPVPASGEPESGIVFDADGDALLETTVYRTDISDASGAMYLVPEPSANWASLRIGSTFIAF